MLSIQDEVDLLVKAKAGDQTASSKLVESITPSLIKGTRRLASKWKIEFDDLFQTGMIGVLDSMSKFDSSCKVRWGHYAIRKAKDSQMAHVMNECGNGIFKRTGLSNWAFWGVVKGMTDEEISTEFDVDIAIVERVRSAIRFVSSLDGDQDSTECRTRIYPELSCVPTCDEDIDAMKLMASVAEAVKKLPKQYRGVITLRYSGDGMSLAQVGEVLGMCEQRVWNIEHMALSKLRDMLGVR
jgi:RNA polymerase sigma factor for flagellar operon FliA